MAIYGFVRGNISDRISKQIENIMNYGCDSVVIEEQMVNADIRLNELIERLRCDDTIVISDISILKMDKEQFVSFLTLIDRKKCKLISAQDNFDSTLTYSIIDNLKLVEKLQILKKEPGRPRITKNKIDKIHFLYENYMMSMREIAEECSVSLGTVHKYLNGEKKDKNTGRI